MKLVDYTKQINRARQDPKEEETGLSAIADRWALAKAEGVYADIRRGLPRGDNAAITAPM